MEESRKEHCSLLEATRQLRRALEELQDQKAELEAQVELLQARSQRLQKYLRCVSAIPCTAKHLSLTWTSPFLPAPVVLPLPAEGTGLLGSLSRSSSVNLSLCHSFVLSTSVL